MYKVYLKPNKEESLKRFHPWVFSGAIAHFDGEPEEGEVVEIYTSKKEFIAKGHFQIGSIAVRVLTFRQEEEINADFWKRKLSIAYDMRRSIGIAGNPTNNTYRLVHGEGDNLPGLVIDIYARTAVMQAHSAGMHLDRMAIADALSVLNMFCYTGGFSVYAMRGDAKLVHSVDSSAKAIDLTNKNIELNFPGDTRHVAYAEDAFKYLDRMGDQYDLIVLDPPAFAKHRDALRNALQGYRKLNVKAFEKIKPGGILFTFSCSQAVSKENFRTAVFTAAAMSGRSVRILHQLTQPADHPVSIYHPEGEYLKGLVLYVE